ncbi:MAG TPA: Spy/CpxP family protein refolding chaperone [Rhodospirillaceae bacterium]|nr:Spy/CpxP family protein refolding chaperone [Rhodospirillaceae bacterium]
MALNKTIVIAAFSFLAASAALAAEPTAPSQKMDHAAMHQMMCSEHFAREAANLAYLESKLDLTEAQRPLFAKWRQSLQDGQAKAKTSCLAGAEKGAGHHTALDHEDHMEKMLAARLEQLQASRPALTALYESLKPEQRQVLDQAAHHHGHRHAGMMNGMEGHHPAMEPMHQ